MKDYSKLYFQEIKEIPLLTKKEEESCFKAILEGEEASNLLKNNKSLTVKEKTILKGKVSSASEAKERLISSNNRLVVSIAKKYANLNQDEFMDLIMAGNIGLSEAIKRFDVEKGNKFSTYASSWIKKHIIEEINKNYLIKIPQYVQTRINKIKQVEIKLTNENGHEPSIKDIAEELNYSEEDILLYYNAIKKLLHLTTDTKKEMNSKNIKVGDEEEDYEYNVDGVNTYNILTGEEQYEKEHMLETLKVVLNELSKEERNVIITKYGFKDEKYKSNREVSLELKIGEEKVRLLHNKALNKLKKRKSMITRRNNENNV